MLVADGHFAILDAYPQGHGPFCQGRQCGCSFCGKVDNSKVAKSFQLVMVLVPPHRHRTPAVGIENDLVGLVAGLAQAVFLGQAQFHPEFDVSGQGFLPEFRFVVCAQAFGKFQVIVGVVFPVR